ncbi:MAG: hypothetical protein H7281_17775 [Bacteriovorax sp.]|nr:hypothetical protein [Bacteriovorax sp.]
MTYTLLGEGYAEYVFLEIYLRRMYAEYKPDTQLVSSRLMKPSGGKSSSSQVLANIQKLCIKSFISRDDIQLFIAGIDLDQQADNDPDLMKYKARIKEMTDKLGKELYGQYKNQILLFAPIQAIDYWILYQFYRLKKEIKTTDNSLESSVKDVTKKRLYGANANKTKIEKIAKDVADKADFEELAKQSKSFKLLHKQVKLFIEKH